MQRYMIKRITLLLLFIGLAWGQTLLDKGICMIHAIFREHIYKRFFRSSQWPKFRKMVIAKHPYCAVCGGTRDLALDITKEADDHTLMLYFAELTYKRIG